MGLHYMSLQSKKIHPKSLPDIKRSFIFPAEYSPMKKFTIAFIILIGCNFLRAQSLKKYDIGSSGCKAYFFCNPGQFEITYSEDSSTVYTGDCKADSLNWGIICVALKHPVPPGQEAEGLLTSYLDFLKTVYKISAAQDMARDIA